MLPTYALSTTVYSPNGNAIEGAYLVAQLTAIDFTEDGVNFPLKVSGKTDANGEVSIDLVSNLIGTQNTRYEITIKQPNGVEVFSGSIQMPESNSDLENLITAEPVTPDYDTAAALSAAEAKAARDEAVPAAATAVQARDEAVEARDEAVPAAQRAEDAEKRINLYFWLGA